jgi:HEPN domain-containing protein
MLTKAEHIEYWKTSSNDDWLTVESLFSSKRYVHCLFFAHLALEKLCKANWVRCNIENTPPRTHNLIKLLEQTDVTLADIDVIFLQGFNDFQIEGRYPDHLFQINQICTIEYTATTLEKVKMIKSCLLEKV